MLLENMYIHFEAPPFEGIEEKEGKGEGKTERHKQGEGHPRIRALQKPVW